MKEVYRWAANSYTNLANDKDMGNAKIMRLRINEIAGELFNILGALGRQNPSNSYRYGED